MKFKKNIAVTAVVLIIAAVMVVLSGCSAGKSLVLTDADTGKVYAKYPISDGDEFSVTFTHSVNKTDVTETYEFRDDEIWLTGCIYYGFGAGVATEMEKGWELSYGEDGSMIISGIEMKMNALTYKVGTVSDHTLRINDEVISLRDLCGRNSSVNFALR